MRNLSHKNGLISY